MKEKVSLKEYVEAQISNLKEIISVKIKSIEDATILAKEELDIHLTSMNEFRGTLTDQASEFITRKELDIIVKSLNKSVKDAGKGRVSWGVAIAITALVSLSSSLMLLLVTQVIK